MSRVLTTYPPSIADRVAADAAKAKSVSRVLAIGRVLTWKCYARASEKAKRRWRDILAHRISEIILDQAAKKIRQEKPHAKL
jgi:hypothetical protein